MGDPVCRKQGCTSGGVGARIRVRTQSVAAVCDLRHRKFVGNQAAARVPVRLRNLLPVYSLKSDLFNSVAIAVMSWAGTNGFAIITLFGTPWDDQS